MTKYRIVNKRKGLVDRIYFGLKVVFHVIGLYLFWGFLSGGTISSYTLFEWLTGPGLGVAYVIIISWALYFKIVTLVCDVFRSVKKGLDKWVAEDKG